MTPENNVQPTPREAPEGLVTGMPENLRTDPEPVVQPVSEAVVTGMPEELKTAAPEAEAMLEAGEQEPLLEAATPPMQEFGGYTNITHPSPEQAEENLRLMQEAAGQPVEVPQVPETPEGTPEQVETEAPILETERQMLDRHVREYQAELSGLYEELRGVDQRSDRAAQLENLIKQTKEDIGRVDRARRNL